MPVRATLRDAQRRLAVLDAAHARAVTKLARAATRRAELLAAQDEVVALAQREVELAITAMTAEVGTELTATLVGRDLADVRRIAKAERRQTVSGRQGRGGE